MNRTVKIIFGIFAVLILMMGAFAGGFITRHALEQTSLFPGFADKPHPDISFTLPNVSGAPDMPANDQASATPADVETVFVPFWETWHLIHQQYVTQPVDDIKLVEGAINGMLQTLDVGLNYYQNPEELKESNEFLNGKNYEGIGAYVDLKGEYLTVISPIKGSPAAQAGLRPGDMVIAIDGESMTGVDPEKARQKVMGPAGTDVVLTIARKGENHPIEVTVTRAEIVTPLVESEMRSDGIAYVRLNTFGGTAGQELRTALEELLAQNPQGLIFDLRYNGGGYLDQGIAVASEFLPENAIVVYERYNDGTLDEFKSSGLGLATEIPMVVLINEGSASASEIVAGAIQDHARAKLVGATSYGKGSVQSVNPLSNEGSVAITSAEWLTPNKRLIQGIGLRPDVYVEHTQADFEAGLDPQLDAAVETLLAILGNTPIPTSMPIPATDTPVP